MYIYIYTCTYIDTSLLDITTFGMTYIHIHTYIYIYVYIYTYIYTCIYICIYIYTYITSNLEMFYAYHFQTGKVLGCNAQTYGSNMGKNLLDLGPYSFFESGSTIYFQKQHPNPLLLVNYTYTYLHTCTERISIDVCIYVSICLHICICT